MRYLRVKEEWLTRGKRSTLIILTATNTFSVKWRREAQTGGSEESSQITPLLASQSRENLEELQLHGDVGDNDGGEAREGKHED